MEHEPIKIKVADESVSSRGRRSGGNSGALLLLGGIALIVICVAVVLFWPRQVTTTPTALEPANTAAKSAQPNDTASGAESPATTTSAAADDGESLWSSPTDGPPIDCSYLLPGTQLLVHVRVADLLSHAEGDKVVAALGPWGQQITQQLTETTNVEPQAIDSLLLGIRQTSSGSIDFVVRLLLRQAVTPDQIGRDCFLPTEGEGKVLVWCTPSALGELKSLQGEQPLFPRELQRVLDRTDEQRMATLVFAGKFLQISGEKFLLGTAETLRTALVDFLGDEATATSISAHWDDNFFVELVSTVTLNERPHRFAAMLEQRVAQSPDQVEDSILAQQLHPHGRKVLARFPAMLRKLGNYTRSGEEDKLSLLRCYLPVNAGHNLLMASELLLNANPMSIAVGPSDTVVKSQTQLSSDPTARLQLTTSLVFPKETLQKALEMLAEDVGVPIQIAGNDLQLEGITKNQSLAIELRDRPAGEILLEVLLRANPDRTASGPTDVKQKLVYVIRKATGSEPSAIVVTTRTAAKRRGEKLPDVFEPASR